MVSEFDAEVAAGALAADLTSVFPAVELSPSVDAALDRSVCRAAREPPTVWHQRFSSFSAVLAIALRSSRYNWLYSWLLARL